MQETIVILSFIIVVLLLGLWIKHKNRRIWVAEQTTKGEYYVILTEEGIDSHYGLFANKTEVIKLVEKNKNGYEIQFIDYKNE